MSWRDHIKVHPAADLFPMMSESELRELGEDIKRNGQKVQVIFWVPSGRSRATAGPLDALLIDGRNRLDAMEMVGLPIGDSYPAFNWRYMEGDPYDLVLSLNINRRHLTEEQRGELIAKIIKAKPDEFLLTCLRAASLRAKLTATELDSIGVALRQNFVSHDGAIEWLHDLDLLDHVIPLAVGICKAAP